MRITEEELRDRASCAWEMLKDCNVCAQDCHVNRLEGELGFCRAPGNAVISNYGPHPGEEDVLAGTNGSGTVFFAHCNLACVFCQNCEISQHDEGREVGARELGNIMLELQDMGCHNINLVSPSHFVPAILEALVPAYQEGLSIPVVYNTGGYDALHTLKLLDGVIDIYMPDIKFGSNEMGKKYSRAPYYFDTVKKAVREMHRQVGDLKIDNRGLATRGLLVRHLVLPGDISGTRAVMEFLAREISPETYVNIMEQYYPAHKAFKYPEIKRRITPGEFSRALEIARGEGLEVV
ncbi:MAG: radical SAM protein [Firmicutes bacterium]|nr:radical SAM protein [Bacillota bacterium]